VGHAQATSECANAPSRAKYLSLEGLPDERRSGEAHQIFVELLSELGALLISFCPV